MNFTQNSEFYDGCFIVKKGMMADTQNVGASDLVIQGVLRPSKAIGEVPESVEVAEVL